MSLSYSFHLVFISHNNLGVINLKKCIDIDKINKNKIEHNDWKSEQFGAMIINYFIPQINVDLVFLI